MSVLSVMTGFQSETNEWEAIIKYDLLKDWENKQKIREDSIRKRQELARDLLQQREEAERRKA
jgi:hypothetical protein